MEQETPDHGTGTTLPPELTALKQATAELLQSRLALVSEAMAEHLFNLSASAQLSPEGRTQAFEAFSQLKSSGKHFVATLQDDIARAFGNMVAANVPGTAQDPTPAELDLVDLREFENSLAIDKIVQAGSERYWIQLESLTLRLGQILGEDPLKIRLPFGLRGLVTAYRRYIDTHDFSDTIVSELDRAFARNLLPELGVFYKELNQSLAEIGVLPEIENQLETSGSQLTPRTEDKLQRSDRDPLSEPVEQRPADAPHRGTLEDASARGGGSASAGQPTPLARAGTGVAQETTTRLADAPPAAVFSSPLDNLAAEVGATEYLPGRGHPASTQTVDGGTLARLRVPALGAGSGGAALPEAELAKQANDLAKQITAARQSGDLKITGTGSLVEQLGLDKLDAALEPLRGSVQLVDNLYQTMIDTLPLSDNLNDSLNNLKLPLAELALREPEFFQNREHPARMLVERLSEVSALAPRNNARVEQRIDDVLSRVEQEFDGDLKVFDTALSKVTELALSMLKQQQRNIQRQVAAEEGKEKREQATALVDKDLGAYLPDGLMPASLLGFIESFMRDELVLLRLRDGQTPLYDEALKRISALDTALQDTIETGNPLSRDRASTLVGNLTNDLGDDFLTGETETILEQLQQQLMGEEPIDLMASSLSEPEIFAEPYFSQRLEKLPRLSRWVRRARQLEPQSWITEELPDGSTRSLQLIWSNTTGTRFAFANEQGHKVKDINLIELARQLGRGLRPLAPSEQLSIIEKSVFQSLEKRQDDLASQSRPSEDLAQMRSDMVDSAQSKIRRAKRRGASECALAIHAEDRAGAEQIIARLQAGGVSIDAEGPLSPSTHGLIVASADTEHLAMLLTDQSSTAPPAGISLAAIDADTENAEELWRKLEDVAKRGLAMSPNTGLVAPKETREKDLAGAVRKTYTRLIEDMAPTFSLRPLQRRGAGRADVSHTRYLALIDGAADISGDLRQGGGYHSSALSIALDCAKVHHVCEYAESLVAAGRTLPLFQINIGTDAALHHEFLDFLLSEVSDSGVGTDRLYFELTDSTRLREEGRAADFARTLRSIGCQISIANVHPKRGSTTQLQSLNPNALALAETLWPLASGDNQMVALHQTISDLHHLVGESVVLRDARDEARAQELGIDFIEVSEEPDLTPSALREALPEIER